MKQYCILIFIILALCDTGHAQKVNFMDLSNEWRVASNSWKPPYDNYYNYYRFTNSITFGSQQYQVLTTNYTGYADTIWVRQDNTTGRIYAITPAYPHYDSVEHILYDFSLKKGDTYSNYKPKYDNSTKQTIIDTTSYYVVATDTVMINGVAHNVQHISVVGTAFTARNIYTVVEGIGSLSGMLAPLHSAHIYVLNERLDCLNNGNPVITSPITIKNFTTDTSSTFITIGTYDNSCPPKLSVDNTNIPVKNITVYPQPAQGSITFELTEVIPSGTIKLYNTQGQTVVNRIINNQQKMQLELDLPPGVYLYTIDNHTNSFGYKGKILIE